MEHIEKYTHPRLEIIEIENEQSFCNAISSLVEDEEMVFVSKRPQQKMWEK